MKTKRFETIDFETEGNLMMSGNELVLVGDVTIEYLDKDEIKKKTVSGQHSRLDYYYEFGITLF